MVLAPGAGAEAGGWRETPCLRVRGRLRRGRLAGARGSGPPSRAARPQLVQFGGDPADVPGRGAEWTVVLLGASRAICGHVSGSGSLGQAEPESNGLCRGPVSVIDRGAGRVVEKKKSTNRDSWGRWSPLAWRWALVLVYIFRT